MIECQCLPAVILTFANFESSSYDFNPAISTTDSLARPCTDLRLGSGTVLLSDSPPHHLHSTLGRTLLSVDAHNSQSSSFGAEVFR